jgi:hypothetical protein
MTAEQDVAKQAICRGAVRGAEDIAAEVLRDYASGETSHDVLSELLAALHEHTVFFLKKVAAL